MTKQGPGGWAGTISQDRAGSALKLTRPDLGRVVSNHLLDSLLNSPPGLPSEDLFGPSGVSPSLLGVITGEVLVDDVDPSLEGTLLLLDLLDGLPDGLGELEDSELVRASNVDLEPGAPRKVSGMVGSCHTLHDRHSRVGCRDRSSRG